MKIGYYLLCMLLYVACNGKQTAAVLDSSAIIDTTVIKENTQGLDTVFKPYKLNRYYTVIDTGEYDAVTMGGHYAIITRDGKITDTIDRGYGIQEIAPDYYLYETLLASTDILGEQSSNTLNADLGPYVLIANANKIKLAEVAELFDDYFSSPSVINGKIYYWQLRNKDDDRPIKLFAAEYNSETHKTTSHYLFSDDMGTDNSAYLLNPYLENGSIIFTIDKKEKYKFSPDFKLIN